MDERIKIINTFKSNYGPLKKGVDRRLRLIKIFGGINILVVFVSWSFILLSILSGLAVESTPDWNKMGIFVLVGISSLLRFPTDIYEWILLNHLRMIQDAPESRVNPESDDEIKNIITRIKGNHLKFWTITLLFSVVLISGVWQVLSENSNPYWIYMKTPVLIIFLYLASSFSIILHKLLRNINSFNKGPGQHV